MLQREVTPTGESSSIIHVVYLLSICLVELLLQVFVQPHTLVLQILRKLLVQKNRSVANVHRWLLCCVRYYRDELWMDMSMGPAGIRTAAGFKSSSDQGFPCCQTKCIFWSHQHCHVPQHFLHWRISGFSCSHHSGLLLICVSSDIFSGMFLVCIFPELHPATPAFQSLVSWYLRS